MGDFTSTKVKRGRLTNFRTGNFVEFLYNPQTVSDRKGSNIIEDAIPGFSDPLIRWASGKARIIQFKLELCGESRIRRSGVNLGNAMAAEQLDPEGFSIEGEIAFFRSFEYPVNPELPGSDAGPDRVLFTMGPMYPGVLCVVEMCDIDVTEWDPDLNPTRATLSISLKSINVPNKYAQFVWSPPIEGFAV